MCVHVADVIKTRLQLQPAVAGGGTNPGLVRERERGKERGCGKEGGALPQESGGGVHIGSFRTHTSRCGAGSLPSLLLTLVLVLQVTTGVLIVRHEGLLRLWAGWGPGVTRAMCYGGEREEAVCLLHCSRP